MRSVLDFFKNQNRTLDDVRPSRADVLARRHVSLDARDNASRDGSMRARAMDRTDRRASSSDVPSRPPVPRRQNPPRIVVVTALARAMTSEDRTSVFIRGVALGACVGACVVTLARSSDAWTEFVGNRLPSSSRRRRDAARREKEAYIDRLGLIPHPEGGFFVETYRTGCAPMSSRGKTAFDAGADADASGTTTSRRADAADDGARNHMTSIYYMLTRESDHQWWALNESDHVHYHHAGGPVTYHLASADGTYERKTLGPDVERGQTPQLVVRGGTYKAAVLERGAEFAIIGEGVSPGFDFRDFKFVSASELARRNAACYDDTSSLVKPQPEDTFDHYYASSPSVEYFTPPGSGSGVSGAR